LPPRRLDTPHLDEYKPEVTKTPMFREHIQKLIDRLDGGIAGVLMGFDGITVDSYARAGFGDALPDVQTLGMEFAHLVAAARRTVESLDAGALQELTIRTDAMTLVVQVLTQEYFLACAMLPAASVGKARYLARVAAPKLQAEL
jgi:predicted regulator of Ras-like GTPase activity (Roadblock/LC7/MglB family)